VTGGVPSPKSKVKETMVSGGGSVSGSDDPEASKLTTSGATPESGLAVKAATGAVFGRQNGLLPTNV
jgi:hypothetical protein